MSDRMHVQSFEVLAKWIRDEYAGNRSIFGIPESLFFSPSDRTKRLSSTLFDQPLGTPFGPAAGPHTQLSQNIISAWLTGGRFIELKTVQIMDELDIPRPCIDMTDEGYNVEWSQELKLEQSVREYRHAWALIHVLHHVLGWDAIPVGTIFNMSVGYNLEGIRTDRMQRFMDEMTRPSPEVESLRAVIRRFFPQSADIPIPPCMTDNVTLSTMHGCPPDEIEAIARYLIEERRLHTTIKLNPTLLGRERVLDILNNRLGFRSIDIPESVFAHDLTYDRAIALVTSLRGAARKAGVRFGIKLSNTLAMKNTLGRLPGGEMYMSGRALYPVTMNLFNVLMSDLEDSIPVSFSAGADALNIADILRCGARPVTVASDLLKPGGYMRMGQYADEILSAMDEAGANSLEAFARNASQSRRELAGAVLTDPRYRKSFIPDEPPRVESALPMFDCITAPCVPNCAVHQDVPEYIHAIERGDTDTAMRIILGRNPLPGVTGHVCTHLCQDRCTRSQYDESVAIRALKRYASERSNPAYIANKSTGHRVAVIGAGPSGLAAAAFLALNGVRVTIYEARDIPGGMLAIAPAFRLPPEVVRTDIDRIRALGVDIVCSHRVTDPPERLLEQGFDAVYVACGFPDDVDLSVPGTEGAGVHQSLDLLERFARNTPPDLGNKVLVIGGGNTAMDVARSAQRITGMPSTVVYRRSVAEMPAEREEIDDLLAEGNRIEELAAPVAVVRDGGRVAALRCIRNRLGAPGADGRRRPEPVEGSEFDIPATAVVFAIGQQADRAWGQGSRIMRDRAGAVRVDPVTGETDARGVYAGGDQVRQPAIIIRACADGRRAAEAICGDLGIPFDAFSVSESETGPDDIGRIKRKRVRKSPQTRAGRQPLTRRSGAELVEWTLTDEEAVREAARCLECRTMCDKCVDVCPNRANVAFRTAKAAIGMPGFRVREGRIEATAVERFEIRQGRQILHIDDFCNECGNCETFCVHRGRPYRDKPRVFLTREGFEVETENAFFWREDGIDVRVGGMTASLSVTAEGVRYEDAGVVLRFDGNLGYRGGEVKDGFSGDVPADRIPVMWVVYRGIRRNLPQIVGAMG